MPLFYEIHKKFLLFLPLLLLLSGCGAPAAAKEARLSIVTDNFAAYDWTREIVGDTPDVELILLTDKGADLHSYQPTVADFARLAEADLFIFIGGESDKWAEDALAETAADTRPLNLMQLLAENGDSLRTEQIIPGMTTRGEHTHTDEAEADEHFWLSLTNAAICTDMIAETIAELDEAHREQYMARKASYLAKLAELDEAYRAAVNNARLDTMIVADRFPFIYLAADYGLNWYAAYPGCSAETGASFETIVFLADRLREISPPCVLTAEKADTALAQTLIATAGAEDCQIAELNSLQAVTTDDIAAGLNYIDTMRSNLAVLIAALD